MSHPCAQASARAGWQTVSTHGGRGSCAWAGVVGPAFGTAAMLAARPGPNTSVSLPMHTRTDS